MEEVSGLSTEDDVNMLSFVTNYKTYLECSSSSPGSEPNPVAALILAGAEIDGLSFTIERDHSQVERFSRALRADPAVSFLRIAELDDVNIKNPLLVPTLAAAIRDTKSLTRIEIAMRNGCESLETMKAVVEIVLPRPDLPVLLHVVEACETLSAEHIAVLRKIRSLQKLYAADNRIDAAAFSDALRNDWTGVQNLTIPMTGLNAAGGKLIGGAIDRVACGLRTLDLASNKLGDSGIADIVDGLLRGYSRASGKKGVLRRLNLERVDFGRSGGLKVAQLVAANPHLMHITMGYTNIGAAGVEFGESLRNCATTLHELHLRKCGLDTKAVVAMCGSLAGAYSLSLLDLGTNRLDNPEEAMRAVAHDLLVGAKSIEELDVSSCDIDRAGMKELAEGLAKNSSLKKLDLSKNSGVGSAIATLMEAMLHSGLKLKELSLDHCDIEDAGGKAIGKFISLSSSLRKLDLGSNQLRADGAREISMGAVQSCSLYSLTLDKNKLGDEGAKHVAEWVIGKSETVWELNLVRIDANVEGAKAIAKAMMEVAGKTKLRNINAGGVASKMAEKVLKTAEAAVRGKINLLMFG